MTDLNYDPYDSTIDADPYPVWKRLRDESPVYRTWEIDESRLDRVHTSTVRGYSSVLMRVR